MNWEELSLLDKASIIATAALNGVYDRNAIIELYNQNQLRQLQDAIERDLILDYVDHRFPASMVIDYVPYRDNNFNPKRDISDNFGNIEYMTREHDTLPYYNDYRKPENLIGKSVTIYNDNNYDVNEAVALDVITHGLREQDSYWRDNILPKLGEAWINADPGYFAALEYKRDVAENGYDGAEPFELHYANAVDGAIRSLLVDPNSPEAQGYNIEDNKWLLETPQMLLAWKEAYDYIMNNDGHILPEVVVTPNQFKKGGKKPRRVRASKYNQDTFQQDYDSAWGGTRYDSPEWRAFWTKLAMRESGFHPTILNSIGAKGYFQLMPFNRSASWSNNLQLFTEADRVLRLMESQLTEDDLRRGARLGLDKQALLAGAWLGGIGGMRATLRGGTRADMNGTTVLSRMRDFNNLYVPTDNKMELVVPQVPQYEDFIAQQESSSEEPNYAIELPEIVVTALAPKKVNREALQYLVDNQVEFDLELAPAVVIPITDLVQQLTAEDMSSRYDRLELELLRNDLQSNMANSQFTHFFGDSDDTKRRLLDLRFARNMNQASLGGNLFEDGGPKSGLGVDYGTQENPILLKELVIPITPEMRALSVMQGRLDRDKPFNDYYQALDMSYPRKLITSVTDKGVSNCTLNATSAYGPEYTFASARNVVHSPLFRQVTGDEVVPGTMLIQSLPDVVDGETNKYHSATFSGVADHPYVNQFGDNIQVGDSLYIYSTGKDEPGAMRERPKSALMGNHGKTRFRYFRPNKVKRKKKAFGGNIYDGETLDTLQMDVRVPILERRPLTEDLKLKIIVYDPDGNIIENPTHAIFDSETGQPVSCDFYNNGRYSFNGVEHLEPVEVIGLAPKKEVPWYNNDMFGFLIGDLRVNTVRNTLARNPNALDNWDVAGNAMEFANIASAGLLNRLSPTQNIGLVIDAFLGDNIMNSWFGNSGIVSDKFLLEHPYWSMAINGIGDAASYSLLNRFRTTSLFRDPTKVYHSDKGNGTGFTGNGAYTLDGYLHPGLTRLEGQSNYIWWNEGEPFSPGFSPKNPTTRMIVADTDMVPGLMRVRDLNYRIGQWNPAAKKSFVRISEMVTPKSVPMENLDVYRRIPRTELWFRTNTAGPLGWYGMRNLSGVKLALGVRQRYVVRSNVDDYTDAYDLYTNGWTHPTHLGYALVGTIKAGEVFNPTDVDLNSIGMIESSGKIGGVSEDLYNAIIGSTGNPILSGDDLLMPEVTTRVWEHFPNRTLIDKLGTHNVLRETNSGITLRIPTPGLRVTLNSPSRPTYVNGNVITFGYPLVEPVQFPVAPYLIGVGASNN